MVPSCGCVSSLSWDLNFLSLDNKRNCIVLYSRDDNYTLTIS